MFFLIDLGTTSLKAALADNEGNIIGKTEVPLGLVHTANPQYRESDPGKWITAVGEAYAFLMVNRDVVLEGIVVSGNGPTLVAVDSEGRPLGYALSWMDRRGVEEARIIKESCGYYIDPTFYLPKAMWMLRHGDYYAGKIDHFLACPEFIIFMLTGKACTILPGDNFLRYFWTDALLEDLKLEGSLFPEFVDPGHPCGGVDGRGSELTGIPVGVPVFAGGPDFVMSLLGTATVYPGRACDRAGTSEGINLCTPTLVRDDRLMGYGHVVRGLYNVSGIISTSGKALEWAMDMVGDSSMTYSEAFEAAGNAVPGARGLLFLPYLSGERAPHWDPHLKGCLMGLSLHHKKGDILRSVMESVGFAMRDVIEVIEQQGYEVADLRITGKPSRSGLWNRIKADITGRRILIPEDPDSELLGDACIAMVGTGKAGSLQEAAGRVVKISETIEPDSGLKALYNDMFYLYRSLHEKTKGIAHTLSGDQKGGIQ